MHDAAIGKMLELAKRLAGEAARFSLPRMGRTESNRKADRTMVTQVDHEIQAHLLGAIGDTYPEHAVVAEEAFARPEAHADRREARYCWVIDPLDGTRNLVAGFPVFATSIAVLERGDPVLGVIYEHNLGHLYESVRGGGVMRNGRPLAVSQPAADEDWLIGVASTKDRFTVSVFREWVAARGLICRNLGATAVHLAMTAGGALAGAFCKPCKIWDVAAGGLFVREAGGIITTPWGDARMPFNLNGDMQADVPFLAGSSGVHRRLLESILSLPGPGV